MSPPRSVGPCTPNIEQPGWRATVRDRVIIVIAINTFVAFLLVRGYSAQAALATAGASSLLALEVQRRAAGLRAGGIA